MERNKKSMILAIVAVISFIVITVGTTVAFFNYAKTGSTENTLETGSISFIYEEVNKIGNGISIEDALPTSDSEGKAQTNYFDFKVTSSTASTIAIPYEITTRVVDGSDDLGDYVKLYLTKVNGNSEEEKVLSIYSDLDDSTNVLASRYNDKTLYEGEIPVDVSNFVENYRLRMWIDDSVDFSDESFNNKTFSIKVNVYANGEQANQQKIASASTTDISGIKINGVTATENTDSSLNYDYYVETDLEEDNDIELVTLNDGQTYTVENITEQEANTLRQVVSKKDLNLVLGDNYLKVTVTSANRKNTEVYVVKINVLRQAMNYKNVSGDSILKILEDNSLKTGYYSFKINNKSEEYKVHLYVYDEDLNITENTKFGTEEDVSTDVDGERQYAKNMVIVKVNGNLTNSAKIEPYYNSDTGYGGPKGFLLYVTGTLTNTGTIDNSHGAYAVGENVYLWKNANDTYEYVPAVGGSGGAAVNGVSAGNSGFAGSTIAATTTWTRATGGGGSGSSHSCTSTKGGNGTSYSGGAGGGGCVSTTGDYMEPGSDVGGIGGTGSADRTGSLGGAGNPHGPAVYKPNTIENGTGGLLIIYANNIINNGNITAKGYRGHYASEMSSGGGASGGGSINIFYSDSYTPGTINVNGGEGGGRSSNLSGAGGLGSSSAMKIVN